jgi:hypothetical protein
MAWDMGSLTAIKFDYSHKKTSDHWTCKITHENIKTHLLTTMSKPYSPWWGQLQNGDEAYRFAPQSKPLHVPFHPGEIEQINWCELVPTSRTYAIKIIT